MIMWLFITLVRLLTADPIEAAHIVAYENPRLARELALTAYRESRNQWVSIHDRDRWAGPVMYRKAHEVGWLDRSCPFHVTATPHSFGVRGSFGLSAAYTMRHFPISCLPPQVLDIPIISAWGAKLRAIHQCERYGACDRKSRRRMWRGNWH